MTGDSDNASQDAPGQHFVLLDETELHLPRADVVLVGVGARDSFWQDAPETDGFLPALDELISDHAGADDPVLADPGAPDPAAPAEVCLLGPAEGMSGISAPSLVDIVVDDGSSGPFVA